MPKYIATVLRDEDGRLYVSPRIINKDMPEQFVMWMLCFDQVSWVMHEGHVYAPASWMRAEYSHLEGMTELLDKMEHAVSEQFPRKQAAQQRPQPAANTPAATP